MGIELSSFEGQSKISNQWLTVNGDDMSKIVASDEKREINVAESTNVSKLKAAVKPEDLNRAANNVYLRGQLLEGLRSSLTGVGKNTVEKFMQEAETALFGELQNGQFGLTEGSQDLSTDTVRSLIDEANRLKAEVGQGGKPTVSNRGIRFDYDGNNNVININNVNNEIVGGDSQDCLRNDSLTEEICTSPKAQSKPVAAGRVPQKISEESANELLKSGGLFDPISCQGELKEFIMTFEERDVPYVKEWMSLLQFDEKFLGDNPQCIFAMGGVKASFAAMLPKLLEKAHAQQLNASESVPFLWKEIGLGDPPKAELSQDKLKLAFFNDLGNRIFEDFISGIGGNLEPNAVKLIKEFLLPSSYGQTFAASREIEKHIDIADGAHGLKNLFESYTELNGLSYDKKLELLKNPGSRPTFKDFIFKMSPGVPGGAKAGSWKPKILNRNDGGQAVDGVLAIVNEELSRLTFSRQLRVKYAFNGKVLVSAGTGNNTPRTPRDNFQNPLREAGFTDQQICQAALYLNNVGKSIKSSVGLVSRQHGSLIDISKDGDNMRVKVSMPHSRVTGFTKPLPGSGKQACIVEDTDQNLVHEFIVRPDGTAETANIGFESSWTVLDAEEEILTTVQKDLRAKCPDATGKQRSALINLDRAGLAKCLGLSGSAARQLQVQSVTPSEIEGFLACSVSGPNNQTYDVLVDQAGVFFRKDQLSAEQVKAGYDELYANLDGISMTVDRLAVTKSFAYSDVKAVSGLLTALSDVSAGVDNILTAEYVKGLLVNKLHAALDQTRVQRTPGGSVQENIVTLWKALGISASAPKKSDPELAKKFFTGLQRTLVDELLDALDVGVGGSQNDKNLREDVFKFLTLENGSDGHDEVKGRLGFTGENEANRQFLAQYFLQACDVSGVPYDLRLKCIKDPSYLPSQSDCLAPLAPDEDVRKFLTKELIVIKNDSGDTQEVPPSEYTYDSRRPEEARKFGGYQPTGETRTVPRKTNCVIVQNKQGGVVKYSDVESDLYEKIKQTEYKDFTLVRSVSYYTNILGPLQGLEDGRYLGVQFKLTRPVKPEPLEQEPLEQDPMKSGPTELETVTIFDPNTKYMTIADKAEMSIKPLKDENFSDEQICQLLRYMNNGYLGPLNGFGMRCEGRKSVIDVSKDKNGDMRVVVRTPSTRYAGLAKTGNTHRLLMRTTENDIVNEFVIRQDGSAKLESFRFEQNPDRKGRTSTVAL